MHTDTHKKLSMGAWWWQTHTHIHTHAYPLSYGCTNTHTFWGASFIALPLHTRTSSCVLEICLMMTHTPIPMPTLDCLHKYIFLLRVYRRRVFLVKTVVLQIVLWDIRAWRTRFLLFCCCCCSFALLISSTSEILRNILLKLSEI